MKDLGDTALDAADRCRQQQRRGGDEFWSALAIALLSDLDCGVEPTGERVRRQITRAEERVVERGAHTPAAELSDGPSTA